jgi:DNA-directed RNA polymerase specialized sigma24 family protein
MNLLPRSAWAMIWDGKQVARPDQEKAELVKLRYFAGLTTGEAAQVSNITEPTVKRWGALARTWLYAAINAADQP